MKYILKNEFINNEAVTKLTPYIEKCRQVVQQTNYEQPEASLCLASDKNEYTAVVELVKKKKTPELKYVIVIGIGGSDLGTKAIYDALYGSVDQYVPDRYPRMFFLDTIDSKINTALLQFFDTHITNENEFIISVISKSGGTTEPLVNAEILLGNIKKRFSKWMERCVVITDEHSKMWEEAKKLNIDILNIQKKVGGRYSVLSAVGLFPLAMAGIDIKSLLQGAGEMRDLCLSDSTENSAKSSSIFQYLSCKEGKGIHNIFFFNPELESLGKWYRQLMGESIGKEGKGITPIISIGSVDHHSMVQLYWGGPQDKTTQLVYSLKTETCQIPNIPLFPTLSTTHGKNTQEIIEAIQKGTAITYEKLKQPYFEIVLEEINEYELGAYMQYKMIEMMYVGHLLEINAFDQPQVELYKNETRKILDKK
jgi:glucose-6-phosphate isomerase